MKNPSFQILLSSLETLVLLLPLGPLLFYPFLLQYGFMDMGHYLKWGFILGGISSLTACLLVFMPLALVFLRRSYLPGTKELAALFSLICLLGVIGLTILHKGLEPTGEAGQALLFGLVLFGISASWIFALRLGRRLGRASQSKGS